MAGFTIIHLSDLHIGQKISEGNNVENIDLNRLADLNAERLAHDFRVVSQEYSIPFRTEETILVITGDITNTAKWEEYEVSINFMRKLKYYFSQYLENDQLLPEHIICIAGNHDIEIPEKIPNNIEIERKIKYRNFKLFLDEITDHAPYAKIFSIDNPFINVSIPSPFQLQFLNINTTLNIHCFSESQAFITSDSLKNLTHPYLFKDIFKIALMHHPLDALASKESDNNEIFQRTLRNRLIDNGVKLILCGHLHLADGMVVRPLDKKESLWELGTGHSFIQSSKTPEEGNYYQIIRIEQLNKNISLIKRQFAWRIGKLDSESNRWESENKYKKIDLIEISDLTDIIGKTDYKNFVGIKSSKEWAVMAHCESRKFENFGVLSPGEKINAQLLELSGSTEGNLIRVNDNSNTEWDKYAGKMALFLVDSPHYNPYVFSALNSYGTYLAGGSVNFCDSRSESPVIQHIQVQSKNFTSNKTEGMKLFDKFNDYLLIMRLPGFVHIMKDMKVEVSNIDRERVIWIVAGIHSKASYAGAMIFTPKNLQTFMLKIQEECGGIIPEYFEAVYETPITPERIDSFTDLKLEHFKVLRLKKEIGMADGLPSSVAIRFLNKKNLDNIPIDTVHFDLVAACNFNCQKCIETEERKKNLYLSLSSCINILCDLKEIGCQNINFYGGEPTLHPDFEKIIRLSSNMGFDMFLVTNGSKLGDQKIKNSIINSKNRIHIRVSIDANSEASHQKNHGLFKDYFSEIKKNIEELVKHNITLTLSFLLYKNSISEIDDACDYWSKRGVAAFILRPITGLCGMNPELDYSSKEKDMIKQVLDKYKTFVFTPSWFESWLNGNEYNTQLTLKQYNQCYSGYYRIAISPFNGGAKDSKKITIDNNTTMSETSNAWMSLCTYRRYDPAYGCKYPQNLKGWIKRERKKILSKIIPSSRCNEIICCRDTYNKQIDEMINA